MERWPPLCYCTGHPGLASSLVPPPGVSLSCSSYNLQTAHCHTGCHNVTSSLLTQLSYGSGGSGPHHPPTRHHHVHLQAPGLAHRNCGLSQTSPNCHHHVSGLSCLARAIKAAGCKEELYYTKLETRRVTKSDPFFIIFGKSILKIQSPISSLI